MKFDDQQARRKAERLRAEEEEEREAQAKAERASQKAKSLKSLKKGRKKRKAVEDGTEDEASTVSESPSDDF